MNEKFTVKRGRTTLRWFWFDSVEIDLTIIVRDMDGFRTFMKEFNSRHTALWLNTQDRGLGGPNPHLDEYLMCLLEEYLQACRNA